MDFLSRLIGGNYVPKRSAPKAAAYDPDSRLARFQKVYNTILELCNRPRNPETEAPLFFQLQACLERLAALTREETRAPVPHVCLQYAAKQQIYAVIGRAAVVSQNEPIIHAAIAVYAALVDSEEEDFLSNATFAKSLMRLITRAVDQSSALVGVETETVILELLFTIAAKIRLQPWILSVWFQSTHKPELDDEFVKEKKSFVGITHKEDFPLCYLLIDRVHLEGRIGDFARTGLLYIFEATGRSKPLEEWVVSSDLSTLMATGLGALYSQLSRELSILHPDATLPAVLAMSDYSTTHLRATAESAFSERHRAHMVTFLSYLAFCQDVLDHCRSSHVKQTLLDHFHILFLQQLLYPSLLQSSDTDAGSSVAVLTYMTAMLETLDYPDLVRIMLVYLLNLQPEEAVDTEDASEEPPRSPTTAKRRRSLMLLAAPKNPDAAIEPALFSLVDLILNSISSKNSQTVFTALKLATTLITKQEKYAFGTVLRTHSTRPRPLMRTAGILDAEVHEYSKLSQLLHRQADIERAYAGLCEDVRSVVEAQVPYTPPKLDFSADQNPDVGKYTLPPHDPLFHALIGLLGMFYTNSVDVNLALTQTFIAIASSTRIRLDGWLAADPSNCTIPDEPSATRSWQASLDVEEVDSWKRLRQASLRAPWNDQSAPLLYKTLAALVQDLDVVRAKISNLDQLVLGRKNMLQATIIDMPPSEPPSPMRSPIPTPQINFPATEHHFGQSPSAGPVSDSRGRLQVGSPSNHSQRSSTSPSPMRLPDRSRSPAMRSVFQPPPPETPSTTDVLMQQITFDEDGKNPRSASLNHILTNVVILQEFILELVAVVQVRAALLGDKEVSFSHYDNVIQDTPADKEQEIERD